MTRTARIFLVVLSASVVSVLCLTPDEIEAERSGWSATPNTQYHIQTDEGPERYFRFQTLNGQFRKEKRLEDGTVIGTEGWLDPLGYLRIKDYIADREGFRILKSKMVFVGKDRPIEDAVAASKRVPAQSGVLAKPRRPPNPFRQPALQDVTGNSIESNTQRPYRLYSPVTRRYHVATTTSSPRAIYYPSTVDPRPILPVGQTDYAKPTTNYLPPSYTIQSPYKAPYRGAYPFVAKPALMMEPPLFAGSAQSAQSPSVQVSPESSYGLYRHDRGAASPNSVGAVASNDARNSTGRRNYRGSATYQFPAGRGGGGSVQASRQRGDVYSAPKPPRNVAVTDRARTIVPAQASDRSDRGADQEHEFPPYDGVHTSADGFQYYLKTHYHEEEKKNDDDASVGSYGYVDPFGIRRVVYYKADPRNGFVHKKNNRYVGFDATPYDPLPQ